MRRHRLDVLSLMTGGLFVALGVSLLAANEDVVDAARWVWPALLVVLGLAGLISALRRDEEAPGEE